MNLSERYREVRARTLELVRGLSPEDCAAQSMPDASPAKWHLAHTTWFFERFVLAHPEPDHRPHHPAYDQLFNSYYDAVGPRIPRSERGLLSRPSLEEILDYREAVNQRMAPFLEDSSRASALELGLMHEEQHQELLLTDLLHLFSRNPLAPSAGYVPADPPVPRGTVRRIGEGLRWVGADPAETSFDNERPRHLEQVGAFELSTALVTVGEYQAFIDDGGYGRPELWLSEGYALAKREGWAGPLYWSPSAPRVQTLAGWVDRDPRAAVCHVSYYEAEAFARWAGARLPTEAEWETAIREVEFPQAFGCRWQWTSSAYAPYPGFRPLQGAFAEYNGKFMVNQYVLRGGSLATPPGHSRASYRNFFPAHARWQFTGIRLARDAA